jgi:hypothetical protein
MYYSNPDCDNQQYPIFVWDDDFLHVWHLGNSLVDTAGSDNGNNHGTSLVSGKVGDARDFERDEGDYIDCGDMAQPGDGSLTTMTWECWIRPKIQDVILMSKYDTSGTDYISYHMDLHDDGKFRIFCASAWQVITEGITDDSFSEVDKWIYLTTTITLGGTNDINAFIDGDEVSVTMLKNSANVLGDIPVTDDIGRSRYESGTGYSDAVMDEIRWSKVVRSDGWIKTSFNTMNDPSSFMSFGPEETGP